MGEIELANHDVDAIAAELELEFNASDPQTPAILSDDDLSKIAEELERELLPTSQTPVPSNPTSVPRATSTATAPTRTAPISLSSPTFRRHAPGPSLAQSRISTSRRPNASFSSAAVPVARRTTTSTVSSFDSSVDEFSVLGRSESNKWKAVVCRDEARVADVTRKPPSRGYKFDLKLVEPLDQNRAAVVMEEALQIASKQISISPSEMNELRNVVRQNCSQYLQYLQSEITSRLLRDNKFNSEAYPAAYSRFIGVKELPE